MLPGNIYVPSFPVVCMRIRYSMRVEYCPLVKALVSSHTTIQHMVKKRTGKIFTTLRVKSKNTKNMLHPFQGRYSKDTP